ncbi:hypothetical protein B0H12DRAFT_450008 [Mycena haematopus]|nr:hypothetical protein B0H12DRAFT_450008 [Mycena haematopus]
MGIERRKSSWSARGGSYEDGAASESDSEDDDSGDEHGDEGITRSAFKELRFPADEGEDERSGKSQGVFDMKFMQRRNAEADMMADDFVAGMDRSDEDDRDRGASGVITHRTGAWWPGYAS